MMISLARAGPTMRTKRVADATPSGTPRSTSGIQSWASAAAIRKSQASVRPQPPPTAWPLIAQMVVCSRPSRTVLARSNRRRNWLLRVANEGDVVRHGGTFITIGLDRHARRDYHSRSHDSPADSSYRDEGAAGIPNGMPSASGGARPARHVTDSTVPRQHEARDHHPVV